MELTTLRCKMGVAVAAVGLGLCVMAPQAHALTTTYDSLEPGQVIQLGDYIVTIGSTDGVLSMTVDSPDGDDGTAAFDGFDAQGVFSTLQAAVPNMANPVASTSETDQSLGRPGMYTSAIAFDDVRVADLETADGPVAAGEGMVEVYPTVADAKSAQLRIQSLQPGTWVYRNGSVLLVLDGRVAPELAAEYEAAMGSPAGTETGTEGGGLLDSLASTLGFGEEAAGEAAESQMTMGQRNALAQAKNYLDFTSFSYTGLIGQLEYEGYSTEDATFAADNCGADWNEQAALKAQEYLNFMSFSRDSLIEQLVYEGFSYEEAEYGATAVGY